MPTSAALRVVNQSRTLAALRRPGPHSRASLAHELKLTKSTVTVIVSALLERGLIHEVNSDARDTKATGRPRVEISLRGAGAYFAGLDVGNETLTVVVVDLNGREVDHDSRPLAAGTSPEDAEAELIQMLHALLTTHPEVTLEGIGITVPGLVSMQGELEWAPRLGWRNVPFGQAVRSAMRVPVFLENDANAAAIGESLFSQTRENVTTGQTANLLYLLLESGVGAGLLVQGQLYRGSFGRVGEAGHIRIPSLSDTGDAVLVEDILDASAFLRFARKDLGNADASWEDLAETGDNLPPALLERREQWQRILGWLTSTLVWLFDPDQIIFGGAGATLLSRDRRAFDQALATNGVDPAFTPYSVSEFGRAATTVGAVSLPMQDFFTIPHDIFTITSTTEQAVGLS